MSECIHCGATDDEPHGLVVGLLGELNETVCNVCRAQQLADKTLLSRREAQVFALKELLGASHSRIGGILDLDKSTVDEYSRRINQKRERARTTVDELDSGN
jgi:ATP/maltotriose-dependent transcriptional regulator MalT